MVDAKYNTRNHKIFCSRSVGVSQFWKGDMGPSKLLRLVIDVKLRMVQRLGFGKDTWFGTSPLAIQCFDIYILCNEHNKTVQ
jgi:hypothetical protein